MIDAELVARKIRLITRDLPKIEELAEHDATAFDETSDDELRAERLLERVIGRMIDINYHVITESGGDPPSDYRESFLLLGHIGVLDRDFAARIAVAAGLRNRIVHEYNDLDPAKVHAALQTAVQDIPEYLRKINAFIAQHAP